MFDVDHRDVLDQDVGDDIRDAVVLTERTDGDTVRTVANEVLNKHVRSVGLEGNAVVAVDDDRISNHQVVRSVSIPYESPEFSE